MWASDIEDASLMASLRTMWSGDCTCARLCMLAHGAIPSLKNVEAEIVLLLVPSESQNGVIDRLYCFPKHVEE